MTETKDKKDFKDLLIEVILPKIELISIILIGIGILFKLLQLQGAQEIFMISMSTYAIVCYLNSFQKYNLDGMLNQFIIKLGGIGSTVLIIGTLFIVLALPGANEMFTIGAPAFTLAFILALFRNLSSESDAYKKIILRHFKTFAIVAIIYLVTFYLN